MSNKKRLREKGVLLENNIFSYFEYNQLNTLIHLDRFFTDIERDPNRSDPLVFKLNEDIGLFATSAFFADPAHILQACTDFGGVTSQYERTAVLTVYCFPNPSPRPVYKVSINFKISDLALTLQGFYNDCLSQSQYNYLSLWHENVRTAIAELQAKKARIEQKLQCNVTFQQEGANAAKEV